MPQLVLYSTAHCGLCDSALELVIGLPAAAGMQLQVIDIAHDDALLERYGERIPVFRLGHRELQAPIDADGLARFLGTAEQA
ncbi:MAG: glutaredoxin family protein [Proteobacteria bacterium]|nr:glutaredoxin family protein [Pseudomonadota bacterium]